MWLETPEKRTGAPYIFSSMTVVSAMQGSLYGCVQLQKTVNPSVEQVFCQINVLDNHPETWLHSFFASSEKPQTQEELHHPQPKTKLCTIYIVHRTNFEYILCNVATFLFIGFHRIKDLLNAKCNFMFIMLITQTIIF